MNRKRIVIILISVFLMLISVLGTVSAANLTVNPGGSIQSAINNASANDTVIVNDNNGSAYTYTENLVINKKINLKSKEGSNVTIRALNSSNPVLNVNSGGSGSNILGFTIKGANNTCGIYLNSTKNCYISKNILIENGDGIFFINSTNNTVYNNTIMFNMFGLDVFNSSNNIIDGNTIINNSKDGINLFMSLSNKINKNIIENNGDGVCLSHSSQNEVCENQIKNNNISGQYNHNTGIDISGSKDIWVYKNVITGHKNHGINIYIYTSSNNTIEENTINDNLGDGIYLREASNNTVKRNLITNNYNGINLDDFSKNNKILENNITFNRGNGIDFGLASDNTTIKGNNITDNWNGIYIWSSSSTITGNNIINNKNDGIYTSTSTTIQFNRISGNGVYGLHSQSSGTINADNNWWGSNNPIASSNIKSDIYKQSNGNIIYDPWLVIKGNASTSQINDGSNVNITLDATYNNRGNNTLSKGFIPDGSPVIFFSLLGTINDSSTLNGKAVSVLTANTEPGKTVVWLTLDNQSISVNLTINPLKTSPVADIIITKTDNSTNHCANVGDTIIITTTAYNSGPSNVTGLVIYDPLPVGFTINSISKGYYNSTTGLWTVGTLVNGTSATLQLIGMVNSSFAQKTLNSTAIKKKQNEYDPTSPNAATASIYVKLADVDITWAVDNARPHIGENDTFTFTATNRGPDNATNISINVPLIPGFTATPSPGTSYANGIWTITSLISGSSANLTITGTVNYSMAGSNINITATKFNQTEFDPDSTDSVTATASVPLPHTDLSITSDAITSFYPSYENLNVQIEIPINNPITWLSIVVHEADEPFVSLVDVIINGEKKFSKYFFNYCLNIPYEMWPEIGVYPINDINIDIKYPYGHISKTETIYYQDGPDAGFETIQSFAIANTKITDDMVQYWLDKKSEYPVGGIKASYGTFMTALTTLWLSDKLADEMAPQLNVTWIRTMPTVVMSGVTGGRAYVHCQDPAMGMNVQGDLDNVKSFRFICSLMLSEVEHMALGSTGVSVDSTLSKIVSAVLNGATFEMSLDTDNNIAILTLECDSRFKIIIDLETGLVRDILDDQGFQLKGAETMSTAYCYHDQLTNNQEQVDKKLLSLGEDVAGGALISAGVLVLLAGGPVGWGVLALILGGVLCLDAAGCFEEPENPRNWIKGATSIGISAIPGGFEAKETILFSKTPWILMKGDGVVNSGSKHVLKATVGGSFSEGTHNVAEKCLESASMDSGLDGIMDYMGVPTHF